MCFLYTREVVLKDRTSSPIVTIVQQMEGPCVLFGLFC